MRPLIQIDAHATQFAHTAGMNVGARISERGVRALVLLLEARESARELQLDEWNFAVEISGLRRRGLTNADLRWLLCKGSIEQAFEVQKISEGRHFSKVLSTLNLRRNSCFVLTEVGTHFAHCAVKSSVDAEAVDLPAEHAKLTQQAIGLAHGEHKFGSTGNGKSHRSVPTWDRDRRALSVGEVLVKQFKVPAPNQIVVLSVFQEESWPIRIDDPLPPCGECDSKRRLHDTINALNRSQRARLIRFRGDGSGQGVRWELFNSDAASV